MADGISPPAAASRPNQTAPAVAVDLRPLTTSELIDRAFSLYRAHFTGLLLLAILCQIAPMASQVLISLSGLAPKDSQIIQNIMSASGQSGAAADHAQASPGKACLILLVYAVAMIIVFCFKVVMTFYVSDAYLGKVPSVMSSLKRLGPRIGASISTYLLTTLLMALTFIFPLGVLIGSYAFAFWHPPDNFFTAILLVIANLLFFILSMVPVLVVFMRIWVTQPPLALEGLSGWKAVWRSVELVRYDPGLGFLYWGEMRLSFLLLPLFVIELLMFFLTALPVGVVRFTESLHHGMAQLNAAPDATIIISSLLTFLAESLILPLYPIVTTLFYYDVRIRREGFDLEFMADNLGGNVR